MKAQHLILEISADGCIQLVWTESEDSVSKSSLILQKEIEKNFKDGFVSGLFYLGFCDKRVDLSSSLDFLRNFSSRFAEKLVHFPDLELIREKVSVPITSGEIKEILRKAPFMTGVEYLSEEVLTFLWEDLQNEFRRRIKKHKGTVADYIKTISLDVHLAGRVYFHLVENKKDERRPFAFLVTYSTGFNVRGVAKHLPLKNALKEFAGDNHKMMDLLATVRLAADQSELLRRILESGEIFHPLAWTAQEAYDFLRDVNIFENSGVICRIPNWWKSRANAFKVSLQVGEAAPASLGMETLLSFSASVHIGDDIIDESEIREIIASSEGLAFIKGKWVEVDGRKLKQALSAFEKIKQTGEKGLSLIEVLRLQMGTSAMLEDFSGEHFEVTNGQWLDSVMNKLRRPAAISNVEPDGQFKARLRDYQQKGLNWLYFLHSLRLGACLADDMGLGKTVQIIAFLSLLKKNKSQAVSLLVIPATIMANWQDEFQRFAPSLKVLVVHPTVNPGGENFLSDASFAQSWDVVITTYGIVQKIVAVQEYDWEYVILDEAQAIKNPGTKQTRAVKRLKSRNRIILTGTPIENSLSDLWSLFDFINPGLLGSPAEFTRFSKSLKTNPEGYARLKDVISPYLLRRLKTDKSIIADLPEKIEMKSIVSLSKRQVVLYQQWVDKMKSALETLEGIERKGLILASIMKLKQICNHPGHYLGNGDFQESDSGKFTRLREICETIFEKREKVLVFSQFKEMTEPLRAFLESVFKRDGLVLHGGVPVANRKKIVRQFQSQDYYPFFILSLKAGGTGLNLTAANHVIHFDRWWNPAVENQATDRAFRIGQSKKTVVHKFITKGTIEEKIDLMLEEKAGLSDSVIQSTDAKWITEMDNKEIVNLCKLTL